jgi:hypothetical protein
MRKILEASLILSLSIVFTTLIMVVAFPEHARGGAEPTPEGPAIAPAVFIDGTHHRPGMHGATKAPTLAGQAESTGCPYLAALAAASRCPATRRSNATSICPYLELHRQDVEDLKSSQVHLRGKHI